MLSIFIWFDIIFIQSNFDSIGDNIYFAATIVQKVSISCDRISNKTYFNISNDVNWNK